MSAALVGYQSAEVLNLDPNGSDNAVEMEPMEKFGTASQRDNSPLVPPVPLHRPGTSTPMPKCAYRMDTRRPPWSSRCTKGLFAC